MRNRLPVRLYAVFLSLTVLFLLACGPIAGLGRRDPTATPLPTATTPPPATATLVPSATPPPPLPTATATTSAPAAAPTTQVEPEIPEGMDLLPCPKPGTSMLLKFSAELRIQAAEADITHSLHDGVLNLMVMQEGDSSAAIQSVEGVAIPYEMKGSMGPCSLAGQGEMSPSAQGYCQEGIVYLTIVENWGAYEGKLTCPDAIMPLNVPPMGAMTHAGKDGRGEVFYLDKNFSTEGAGYTSIRPFAAGSGDHVWTLFLDATGPVAPQ